MKATTKEVLRLPSTEKFKSYEDGDELFIEGFASTNDVDRDYEVIPSSAVDLESFKKNPIILYQHDRSDPIGKCVEVERKDNGIWLKVLISKTATKVSQMIKEGILSTFSCGFRIKDYDLKDDGLLIYKDIEFLETSIVSIPCNPEARFNMCKSYNEDNLIKGTKTPTTNKKEDNTMSVELEKMKSELEAIKAEKTRLETEKAAELVRVKAEKDAAEKAKMVESIKTLSETVVAANEKIEAAEKALEAVKTELTEELESIKKAAPRVENVPLSRKEIDENMEAYKEALICKQLFGYDKLEESKAFDALPEGLKSVTLDAQFTTRVQKSLLSDIKNEASIYPLFREIPSDVTTDVIPFGPEVVSAWGTSASDQGFTPDKVTMDYYSIFSRIDHNYVINEEDIIAWLPFVKTSIVASIASGIDKQLLDSAASPSATFRGLASWAIGRAASAGTSSVADEADLTVADIDAMRANLGKYGVQANDLILVLNSDKYLQLVDDDLVTPVDKFGPKATIHNGQLGSVRGISIIVNDNAVGSSTAGAASYAATMFNTKFFGVKMKSVMTEFDKTITSQTSCMVSSARVGFGPLFPLISNQLNNAIVVVGKNPTS